MKWTGTPTRRSCAASGDVIKALRFLLRSFGKPGIDIITNISPVSHGLLERNRQEEY